MARSAAGARERLASDSVGSLARADTGASTPHGQCNCGRSAPRSRVLTTVDRRTAGAGNGGSAPLPASRERERRLPLPPKRKCRNSKRLLPKSTRRCSAIVMRCASDSAPCGGRKPRANRTTDFSRRSNATLMPLVFGCSSAAMADRMYRSWTDLPVLHHQAEITAAIRNHAVVVLSGETGSGKSTQVPKMCLAAGFGISGLIGHTQPRRVAARSVAARIAEELDRPLGQDVGFKIRFTDKTNPRTYIKLMTDGILLAETQGDRFLERYEVIILDEAHERSLNIDFLLGYFRRLIERRPELRLVITSGDHRRRTFPTAFCRRRPLRAGD